MTQDKKQENIGVEISQGLLVLCLLLGIVGFGICKSFS
jgi:hypothetical protein